MKKILHWFLVFGVLIAVFLSACATPAQASLSPSNVEVSEALPESLPEALPEALPETLPESSGFPGSTYQGTVKPPPPFITGCEPDDYLLGGVAVIKALELPSGYCLAAELMPPFAIGRLPDDAGQFLGDAVNIRYFKDGDQQYELPPSSEDVEVCFAVRPGSEPQIYFFDFYGPKFGKRTGQPDWEPLETTEADGMVCASAMPSGAYALVGQ